jgi:plastocyanin
MHIQALHLALTIPLRPPPVLAAEKSKVPFYIAGGVLVLWALIVSLALGIRHPQFPRNLTGERTVITITAILVLAAVSTAVITSSPPAKAGASASTTPPYKTTEAPPAPAPAAPAGTAKPAPAETAKPAAPATSAIPRARASTKLNLAANPTGLLSYNTKQLSAKAGAVTIEMANSSPLEHDVTVAQGSTVLGATPKFIGGTRSLTIALKPGTYTFYCSVPGHRQAGMEGTLSVS